MGVAEPPGAADFLHILRLCIFNQLWLFSEEVPAYRTNYFAFRSLLRSRKRNPGAGAAHYETDRIRFSDFHAKTPRRRKAQAE